MNVTDPLNGLGGIDLPYGSIEQLEVLSGGYGAAFGRSDGGVLNQVGKRGTNEWHFGAQVLYTPSRHRVQARHPILYPTALRAPWKAASIGIAVNPLKRRFTAPTPVVR